MRAYKTTVKLNDLKKAVKVPSDINSSEVELIILSNNNPYSTNRDPKKTNDLAGIFSEYAKPELIKNEKEKAWTQAVREKHDIL